MAAGSGEEDFVVDATATTKNTEEKEISIDSSSSPLLTLTGDGTATPSRSELLRMVKKHSNFLGWTVVDIQDASDISMDDKFWHEVLDLYFIRGRVSKGREEDDLVFFVRNMSLHGYGFNDSMDDIAPYFVRRWATTIEKVIGRNSVEVDWARSFYLNLIAHTSFTVTVAICSTQALRRHKTDDNVSLSPIYKVVKTVYASPSRVNFHLDHKKAVETQPAYPNICFAVDDFDDTFDAVVLSDLDHSYCVILNAHDGAAFPAEVDSGCCDSTVQSKGDSTGNTEKLSKCTLFSGFVSYPMVREAYNAGKSRFGSLLSFGQPKTDKLFMRGPQGRGEVEVAVSGITDQSHERTHLQSPFQSSKKGAGGGLGAMFHRAAAAASELAKHAYEATSDNNRPDDELLPLKCCLMSISLPWEYITQDLLFKESAPLNL